jgi:hypothetical protein
MRFHHAFAGWRAEGVSAASQSSLPRLAFRVGEAAEVLGVSEDTFARHIAPQLRWTRCGAVKLVAATELQKWLDASAARVLDDESA